MRSRSSRTCRTTSSAPWIDELSRIAAPGGLLLLTTHGDSYADRLDADERATYESSREQDLVVFRKPAPGTAARS
jgi:hypothetical protein